ncbi:uncharacterized protein TEOVI_000883300 [Trypanosoma equiperdum]|uniref:Uncharacterized protein n=1 Tax=Trypanosoma equiperdum TaxID=5694 RepID=A0A1G4I2N9_TRYEQ|nr:hypothetical protein, conserved [Trypanosoma equiperdum]
MKSANVPTENVLSQITHLTPVDVSELLVRRGGVEPVISPPRAGVYFGQLPHGFGRMVSETKKHCLHWSSHDVTRSPAVCFPVVGDILRREKRSEMIQLTHKDGATSFFAPQKRERGRIEALLFLGSAEGGHTQMFRPVHNSWSFHAQMLTGTERNGLCTTSQFMELFLKKLVMWVFYYLARTSATYITIYNLEMAFPILTAISLQDRRYLVEEAANRFALGMLSYYDDRIICRQRPPVNAVLLLSTEELRSVTSVEQASAAFIYRCQMKHNTILSALQYIIEYWGKRSTVFRSSVIQQAVSIILSHVSCTYSLLPALGAKSWIRTCTFRHMLLLLSQRGETLATSIVSTLRSSRPLKASRCAEFSKMLEQLVLTEPLAVGPVSDTSEMHEVEDVFFLESVTLESNPNTKTVWKAEKNTFRFASVPSADIPSVSDKQLISNSADLLFATALYSCGRLQFSLPLLKCAHAKAETCLKLHLGGDLFVDSDSDSEKVVWRSLRMGRRRRKGY